MPRPAGGRKDSCFGEAQLRRRQSVTAASLPPSLRGIRRQSAWWPPLVISRVRAVVEPFTSSISQRSEEHTSELQSLMRISYAVFCLKKKKQHTPKKKTVQARRSKYITLIKE